MSAHPHGSPPRECKIIQTELVGRTLKRLRVQTESFRSLSFHAGQQVRVKVDGDEDLTLRTYSVWDYQPGEDWLDLIVMLHGKGPGSAWAEKAEVGDTVTLFGPLGSFVVNPRAHSHVFVGDETGVVAMQSMIRSLPGETPVIAIFEGDQPEDAIPPVREGAETWVFRNGSAAGQDSAMCQALKELKLPEEPTVVYLAGEMSACLSMRDFLLKEPGWKRMFIRCKTFWAHGKTGIT